MGKLLQKFRLRELGQLSKISGFTLIELLVAAFIAGIIVSSLLAFLVGILRQDQVEEARVQTQNEVQAALNFIANDLKEAIYIYDADGVERSSTETPPGIRDQIPDISATTNSRPGIPILVFWKRSLVDRNQGFRLGGANPSFATCSNPSDTTLTCRAVRSFEFGDANGSDIFRLSLVGYYLRSNRAGGGANSASMQIDRWEVSDGIRSTCTAQRGTTDATPQPECEQGAPGTPRDRAPIVRRQSGVDINGIAVFDNYWVPPNQNFQRFSLAGVGSFRDKLNRYRSIGGGGDFMGPRNEEFNARTQVLLDYVDDNFYVASQDDGTPDADAIEVPVGPNAAAPTNPNNFVRDNPSCARPDIGVGRNPENGIVDGQFAIATQRIPSTFTASTALDTANNASSFYVCVNSLQNIARVWIRGNAEARTKPLANQRPLRGTNSLATGSIRVSGRSSLNVNLNN